MESKLLTPQTTFKNPEEEMAYLRQFIAEKEKALQEVGLTKEALAPTREVLAEYKVTPAAKVLHPEYEIKKEEIEKIVLKLAPEEHDIQVNELVLLAKEKGVKN